MKSIAVLLSIMAVLSLTACGEKLTKKVHASSSGTEGNDGELSENLGPDPSAPEANASTPEANAPTQEEEICSSESEDKNEGDIKLQKDEEFLNYLKTFEEAPPLEENCDDSNHPEEKRIRYREPHVDDIKSCEEEEQHSFCKNGKKKWSGSYKFTVCTTLPYIKLSLKPEALEVIKKVREKALEARVLLPEFKKTVEGNIFVNNRTYKVEVSLKGDWSDHWEDEKKMSFKIKTQHDQSIFGMSEFSIQKLEVRGGITESFMIRSLQDAGLITPRHFFVMYEFNNDFIGEMAIEERISNKTLESTGHVDGPIFRLRDDFVWRYIVHNEGWSPRGFFPQAESMNGSFLLKNPSFNSIATEGIGLLRYGFKNGQKNYDHDSYYEHLAYKVIFNAWHANANHNIRFYFDPFQKKFKLIHNDGDTGRIYPDSFEDRRASHYLWEIDSDPIFQRYIIDFIHNIETNKNFFEKFSTYSSELSGKTKGYSFQTDHQSVVDLVKINMEKWKRGVQLPRTSQKKIDAQDIETMKFPDPLQVYYIEENHNLAHLDFINSTRLDLEIVKIEFVDKNKTIHAIPLQESLQIPPLKSIKNFKVPKYREDCQKCAYLVTSKIRGNELKVTESIPYADEIEKNSISKSLDEFQKEFPEFSVDDYNKRIIIPNGTYEIKKDLLPPDNFGITIEPNAIIKIGKGVRIFSKDYLRINGEEGKPVTITSIHPEEKWGGILVLGKTKESKINKTKFENISYSCRKNQIPSGGIMFYESNVNLSDVTIRNIDDRIALKAVRSRFNFNNMDIENSSGSGIQFEFSDGTISNSRFTNLKGSGLLSRKSKVISKNNQFLNVAQNSIELNAFSDFQGKGDFLDGSKIGVLSKNGSSANIDDYKMIRVETPYQSESFVENRPSRIEIASSTAIDYKNLHVTDLSSTILTKNKISDPYKFFVAGTASGLKSQPGLFPPFQKELMKIKDDSSLSFGVLLGDALSGDSYDHWGQFFKDLKDFNKSIFLVKGNRESQLSANQYFASYYENSFYYKNINNDLFIYLDSTRDHRRIEGHQLNFLKDLLNKQKESLRNIFIFTHDLIWSGIDKRFEMILTNTSEQISNQKNFLEEVEPLLNRQSSDVYFIAGNVGSTDLANACTYQKFNNVHYISTGMGHPEKSNYIEVKVNELGSVMLNLKFLGQSSAATNEVKSYCEIKPYTSFVGL